MTTHTKLEKAMVQITLDHPFFATILYKFPVKARMDIPTMGVNKRGEIFYNPDFIEQLTVPQIQWALCHEVMHVVDMHVIRMGARDHKMWNIASDAWINDTLDDCRIGQRIPNTVNMPGSKDDTVENIYDRMPQQQQQQSQGQGQGQGQGQDTQWEDGIGDDLIDDGEPISEAEAHQIAAAMKVTLAQAAQVAKMRGKMPGKLVDFVTRTLHVKTPWYQILERHMVAMTSQNYRWTRPNRRFLPHNLYMPSIQNEPSMGQIALQIDISGSVSEREIAYYNGHISRIVEMCNPEKVYVIYTDYEVHHVDEFEQGEIPVISYHAGGGTDMREGFKYLEDNGIDVDVVVTLTDGYTPFPEETAVPAIWCISSSVSSPTGETVHFDMHD